MWMLTQVKSSRSKRINPARAGEYSTRSGHFYRRKANRGGASLHDCFVPLVKIDDSSIPLSPNETPTHPGAREKKVQLLYVSPFHLPLTMNDDEILFI